MGRRSGLSVCGYSQGRGRAVDHRPVLHDVRLTLGRRCDRVASGSRGVDAQGQCRNERRTLGAVIGRRVISAGAAGAAILLAASCAGTTARQPSAASAPTAQAAQPAPGPSHRAAPRPGPAPARPLWPAFSATVSGPLIPGDVPFSWHPGCPVPPGQLRAIRLSYVGFDGRAHTGEIIVNASVVHQVIEVFSLLYRARFPISRMEPVDVFHGSDPRSMAADNTSGFNCRSAVASGPPRWSMHAYGLAIDVNTIQKSSAARRVTGHRTDKAGKRMPNELFRASITSRSRLLNQVQNQRSARRRARNGVTLGH